MTDPDRVGRDVDLRVGIDVSSAARPVRTGVGRYISELVDALSTLASGCRFDLLYRPSRWKHRRFFLPRPDGTFRTRWLLERFHFGYPARLDVFHGPDARLPAYRNVAFVASVHDTFSADTEAFADSGFRAKKMGRYQDLARRADALITFSDYTRQRFLHHTDARADLMHVIPHGVGSRFGEVMPDAVERVKQRFRLMRPYFFYVGQLSRRKNLVRMFEAFADVDPAFDLVIAGPRSHGVDEIEAAHRRLRLGERVHLLGPVSESDLAALYVGAVLHVLLSLDEGFGLPVLEAFQAGTPVLASDRGAIPEVAGDAALLVNPEDVPVIRDAMQRLAEDVDLRARLIQKGKERVRAFGWRRSAEQTLALYRHVAGARAMGGMHQAPGHPAPGDPVSHSGP